MEAAARLSLPEQGPAGLAGYADRYPVVPAGAPESARTAAQAFLRAMKAAGLLTDPTEAERHQRIPAPVDPTTLQTQGGRRGTGLGAVHAAILFSMGGALIFLGTKRQRPTGVFLKLAGGALMFHGCTLLEDDWLRPMPQHVVPIPGRAAAVSPERSVQPETFASLDTMVAFLDQVLRQRFARSRYMTVEVESVLHALVRSVGRSARRVAAQRSDSEPRHVMTFVTTDRFSSPWMDREEILQLIRRMSGLEAAAAEVALTAIEGAVDTELARSDSVDIAHLGRVSRAGAGYAIQLADELQVHPITWAA